MGQYQKDVPVHRNVCLSLSVPDVWTSENRQNLSLSLGKVPKIFTCKPIFTCRGQADSQ